MVDSALVLNGQTIVYSIYAVIILLLMAWFGFKITTTGKSTNIKPWFFYSFVIMLVVIGVSLHIVTYNTIPWVAMDLDRAEIEADQTFDITVKDHKFYLPAEKMIIEVDEKVLFDVTSEDLTYGFGVFREDNTMVFQMQVVPGHRNDILWQFKHPGLYTIRSTEYSGPAGISMIEKNVVEVIEKAI